MAKILIPFIAVIEKLKETWTTIIALTYEETIIVSNSRGIRRVILQRDHLPVLLLF